MKIFVIETKIPNFEGAQVGDIVQNKTSDPVDIKAWATGTIDRRNGYSPQIILPGDSVTLEEGNLPVAVHKGMGYT